MDMLAALRARIGDSVKAGEPMAPHTTLRVGGPADYFFEARTADDAVRAAHAARELGVPLFVFGGGSNMLVSDTGVRGLVLMMANRDIAIDAATGVVRAGAGASTGAVSTQAARAGLSGFSWAVGVPGTIGGAVRGNAGAYGGDMAASVVRVRALKDGEPRELTGAECAFTYRHSLFKNEPGWVVLEVELALTPGANASDETAKLRQILLDRKEKQPVEFPTAGCMFTNWMPRSPEEAVAVTKALDVSAGEQVPRTPQGGIPAGWLVDRAGLKDMALTHVRVSEKHANFLVTDGHATADDIVQLTAAVKTRVRNATDGAVLLKEEVEYVGF